MKTNLIFLDIDGTLCGPGGVVPPSAIDACQKARQNGHLIFLCTGRSKVEISDELMAIGFDGVIGAAGGYIELQSQMIKHINMSKEQLISLKSFFNERQIPYIFEANSGLFCERGTKAKVESLIREARQIPKDQPVQNYFLDLLIETEDLIREDVNKVAFLQSETTVQEVKEAFEGLFHVIPCTIPAFGPNSGEITIPDIHKAVAIEELLQYLGCDRQQTIALGDGVNDLEMLEYVQLGIAMGNAPESVKQVADEVTDSLNEEGLFKAFQKHHLI